MFDVSACESGRVKGRRVTCCGIQANACLGSDVDSWYLQSACSVDARYLWRKVSQSDHLPQLVDVCQGSDISLHPPQDGVTTCHAVEGLVRATAKVINQGLRNRVKVLMLTFGSSDCTCVDSVVAKTHAPFHPPQSYSRPLQHLRHLPHLLNEKLNCRSRPGAASPSRRDCPTN